MRKTSLRLIGGLDAHVRRAVWLLGIVPFLVSARDARTDVDTLRRQCVAFGGRPVLEKGRQYCEIFSSRLEKLPRGAETDSITTLPLLIRSSDITLDCGGRSFAPADDTEGSGLLIRTPEGQPPISNITVKNCAFRGFTNGVLVAIDASLKERREAVANATENELRRRSPANVKLQNITAEQNNNGIYLHYYTVGVTVADSKLFRNKSVGMYLEYGSQAHRILNNSFVENGYLHDNGAARKGLNKREGLAIDASAFNEVIGNTFDKNAAGGIFLYKNCHEHAFAACSATENKPKNAARTQHSHHNVIRGNIFRNMDTYPGVGVWVASRQSRDMSSWHCGDAQPEAYSRFDVWEMNADGTKKWPLKKHVLDFAEDNRIEANFFSQLRKGVVVEDDRTQIVGNLFIGDFEFIQVGTEFRSTFLGLPVRGTEIKGNTHFLRSSGFGDKVSLLFGSENLTSLSDNRIGCVSPWGSVHRSGEQITAYADKSAMGSCRSEVRTCNNGVLSGDFAFENCISNPSKQPKEKERVGG
jgi:hypothetical protein